MQNSDLLTPEDTDDNESVTSATGDPKIFEDNTIFVWFLPWNMPEQRLFDTLYDVFSTVGQIKVITRKNSNNQSIGSITL